jgi:hypothetical protein
MTVHDIVIGFLLFFPWALIAVELVGAGLQSGINRSSSREAQPIARRGNIGNRPHAALTYSRG